MKTFRISILFLSFACGAPKQNDTAEHTEASPSFEETETQEPGDDGDFPSNEDDTESEQSGDPSDDESQSEEQGTPEDENDDVADTDTEESDEESDEDEPWEPDDEASTESIGDPTTVYGIDLPTTLPPSGSSGTPASCARCASARHSAEPRYSLLTAMRTAAAF